MRLSSRYSPSYEVIPSGETVLPLPVLQLFSSRFDRNGNLIDVSNYENGVRTGKSVSFDENGNIVVSVYENGEKISEFLVDAEV